jgi:hypothetical protein
VNCGANVSGKREAASGNNLPLRRNFTALKSRL